MPQIVVLNTTKQVMTRHIDEESARRSRSEADLKDMTKKFQATKLKLEVHTFHCENTTFIDL